MNAGHTLCDLLHGLRYDINLTIGENRLLNAAKFVSVPTERDPTLVPQAFWVFDECILRRPCQRSALFQSYVSFKQIRSSVALVHCKFTAVGGTKSLT